MMAIQDDFQILKDFVESPGSRKSIQLPDGRTFTLEQARDERDRLLGLLNAAEKEKSDKDRQISDAEKIVNKRQAAYNQQLRAFNKNNASAQEVSEASTQLQTAQEFLARLKGVTAPVVPATTPATTTEPTPVGGVAVLSRKQRGESVTATPTGVLDEEPPPPLATGGKKVVFTKAQVDAKLVELGLADTPENRKTARQALKTGKTAAPAAEDKSWEPIFKEKYPQYAWMFTDLDRTKYADVFTLFNKATKQTMTPQEFDQQFIGTSWYTELATSKKARELSAAIGNFTWGSGNLAKFLTKAIQFGYEGENLKQQAYKDLFSKVDNKYVNDLAVKEVRASTPYLALKRIGTQFLTAFNDETVENALTGGKSADDLLRISRETAKALYPHLKDSIDAGVTLEDLAANYKQIAARTLELDPSQVDMGLKFNEALNYTRDGAPRMLSLSEWETELRTNDKYKYSFTKQANQDATSIGLAIARAFGKVQ